MAARLWQRLAFSRFPNSPKCTIRAMATASTDKNLVEVEKVGSVLLIGINRPENRNAINPATAKVLYSAFKEFENDSDCHVAVLHGKGGNFCAGYDLKELSRVNADDENMQEIGEPIDHELGFMGPSRMAFSKPVIAAVSGYAVAGGLELALMCDLRVVEENAIMGVFCRRFGVPLLDGGTVRLPQLIGLSRALDLILTGRPVGAKEALEMGLANRVVSTGTALGSAILLANSLVKFPQECMNADRRSAYYSCYEAKSVQDALQHEYIDGVKVLTKESIPGAKTFADGIGRHGSFNLNVKSNL
ncbi:short-chain-enoyl-CoA hydratase-like isoform X2 [Liolophura sinensis]|uniref:short-chain-enoyl-CoA hydratase-like isoform X2 n=1 Tax=Liolophura sinensis TaxID=3198878 RepID=UPI0031586DA6